MFFCCTQSRVIGNRPRVWAKARIPALLLIAMSVMSWADEPIRRLDLFDRAGNFLLYITFDYDASSRLTGRTIRDFDGSLLHRTVVKRNGDGARTGETFVNGAGITEYWADYADSGDGGTFALYDRYSAHPDRLIHQGHHKKAIEAGRFAFFDDAGVRTHEVRYEYDGAGNPRRITIHDRNGTLTHYGIPGTTAAVRASTPQTTTVSLRIGRVPGAIRCHVAQPPSSPPPRIRLHDCRGKTVEVEPTHAGGSGFHTVTLATESLPTGLYFVKLVSGSRTLHRTVSVVR